MQVSTLACDYCTGVRAAVKVVRLAIDGVPEKAWLRLDLCKKHLQALERAFKGRMRGKAGTVMKHEWLSVGERLGRVNQHRKADLIRYHGKPKKTGPRQLSTDALARLKARHEATWAARQEQVLALCPNGGKAITATELRRKTKLEHSAFGHVMRRLIEQGIVKRHGSARWTTYERV